MKAKRQETGTLSVGQKAEVPNAHEAFGEQVQEKTAQELVHGQSHELLLVPVSRVAPAKRNLAIGEGNQPMIGNGYAVGVAAEILQDMLGTAERGLGVDHPVFAEEQSQPGSERFGLPKRSECSCEMEWAVVENLRPCGCSSVWYVANNYEPDLHLTRSVRRTGGFVLTGLPDDSSQREERRDDKASVGRPRQGRSPARDE